MLFILNKIGQFCKNVIKLCSLYNLLGLSASCYMNSVRSRVIYVFKFWILFCVYKNSFKINVRKRKVGNKIVLV